MEASNACFNLIRISEGLKFNPYQDAAGYWTVGFGHKIKANEIPAPVTYQEAEDLLYGDVEQVQQEVNDLITDLVLTQGQFDALVDFTYNLGITALAESTLLRLLKIGDIFGASTEFLRWVHADVGGRVEVLDGLVRRRNAERLMFLSGMPLGNL